MTDAQQFLGPLHLAAGKHDRGSEMCAMEAAAYLAGEPHSDHPICVCPTIGAFMRNWNDGLPDDQRDMLKPWIVKCLHTRSGPADAETRSWMALDWLVRVQAPAWLDLAGLTGDAMALRNLPVLTSSEICVAVQSVLDGMRQRAAAAWDAAGAAAWAAAGAAAWDAARDAARAAARAAARDAARDAAWDAARDAARAAARAAAWAAARAAAWDAARDAARAAARDAARAAARAAAWDAAWAAAWDAARDAARDAAQKQLAPTVKKLQASAFELLERMIALGQPIEPPVVHQTEHHT